MKIVCLVSLLLVGTASAFQNSQSSSQRTGSSSTRTLNNQIRTPKPFQPVHNRKPISTSVADSKTQLQVLPAALAAVTAPVGSISVLAFVILVHEAGHFLAARSQGIKVKEFSVGVGPKLFGFTRKAEGDDEDEGIEFNLRAIPLGGYVRFPENYNATLEYQLAVEADTKREEINQIVKENRENQPAAGGGGLLSTVGLSFGSGKATKEERIKALESMAIQISEQEKSSNPWWKGIFGSKSSSLKEERNQIIIEQDGTVSVPPIDYYSDPDLLQNRPWAQRSLVLVGGVVFNIILAFSLYFGELTIGNGLQKPVFGQGAMVTSVARANSAGVGILDRGDVILSVNGKFLSPENPTAYNSGDTISSFISSIRATAPGDALHLSVLKYNAKVAADLDLRPLPMNDNDDKSPLSIGVMIAPNYTGNEMMKATNPADAAVKAATEVSQLTSATAKGILKFLSGLVSSGGSSPAGQSLSGPIGVIKQGSAVVATNDFSAVIGFAAAISINLAVVNSLPLPALDGGQLLFVLSEALTGKKIDQRKQEEITSATLLFLFLVTISTTVGDVGSLFNK